MKTFAFTIEDLQNSEIYQTWTRGQEIRKIYNVYRGQTDATPAYIVLYSIMGKWTILRFFTISDKIQVSIDYEDISSEEVFDVLMDQYSSALQ